MIQVERFGMTVKEDIIHVTIYGGAGHVTQFRHTKTFARPPITNWKQQFEVSKDCFRLLHLIKKTHLRMA